jgi:hypothetical protein
LLADHELNPSAFAARVAASTGASLAASALAGLAALSGPRHGGAPAALSLFRSEALGRGVADAVSARLRRERRALVESDAGYTASHPLVRKIDAALAERRRQARAAPEAAGGTRGAE